MTHFKRSLTSILNQRVRRLFLLCIALLLFVGIESGYSQSRLSGGVRAGVSVANLSGNDVSGSNKFTAPRAEFFLNYALTDWFSVQPELSFNSEGGSNSMMMNGFPYQNARVTYLQVPLLLKISSANDLLFDNFRPSLFAGPSANFMVFKSVQGEILDNVTGGYSINQRAKDVAYNMVAGIGGTINDLYLIDLRYNYGLSSAFEDGDVKTNSIALTIGFKF